MQPDLIELNKKLDAHNEKIDKIYASVEKTRKYFLWTIIITLVLFIVPLILMIFVLPSFMNNYIGSLSVF